MAMHEIQPNDVPIRSKLRPVRLVAAVLVLLTLIFSSSRWYADMVSIPRYCAQPEIALQHLAAVLTEERPAGEGPRRNYIVAAKLGFLLPAKADENAELYLRRLRNYLEQQCD